MDFVRVKFYLPGVKLSSKHTLFVVKSLPFAIVSPFLVLFLGQMKQKWENMNIKVCIEGNLGNLEVK